jgi:hypothetical protein
MKKSNSTERTGSVVAVLAVLVLAGATLQAADTAAPADKPAFKPEELEQILAPIALYQDTLLTQMLMASTYPLEVVQADRWVKQNKDVKSDALTTALEAQSWDPSVKSLVNFPPVLAMMSENLETTVKIGDAFIGQQKDVMATIQKLRGKAQETGNLKTTPEQKVAVEQQGATQVIIIESASPEVVYVPTYPPTVYYPTWPYPAYPPAPYYPPGYVAGKALAFGAGVALGAAWGYAWGHSDWHGGSVDIDVNRNTNINTNINRSQYQAQLQARNTNIQNGRGTFQHDPAHRQGVAYRDQKTATQFGRTTPADAAKARESFRGRDAGGVGGPGSAGNVAGPGKTGGAGGPGRAGGAGSSQRPSPQANNSAFEGVDRGGSAARMESSRGSASRAASPSRPAPSQPAARPPSGGGSRGGRR